MVTGNPERGERARREHPGVRVEPSADRIWQRADELDFAVVATPNESHVELAMRAADCGLAVVVDKPLATTAADGRALVAHAEQRGVLLTVFQNRRWDSDHLTLRRLIAEGRLGEIFRYESRFERWRPQLREPAGGETRTGSDSAGVLLDLHPHLVDQALRLFGPVQRVHTEIDRRRGGPADDDAFLALEHAGGVHSHLWASSVAASPGPRLRVLGSEGAFVLDQGDGQEQALERGRRPTGPGTWGIEPRASWGRLVRGDELQPLRSEPGAWPVFYERLAVALAGEGEVPVDPRDAVEALEIIEAAVCSPQTQA